MRERPQASAVARRVPIEAYPSPGKSGGGGGDGYYRSQRQSQRQQQVEPQFQQQQEPPRPHSYIGFSRPDSYGGSLDFYSNRYNRNASRNQGNRGGALSRGSLRPNKSSNDLFSAAEASDVCEPSANLYRELLNGSPCPSVYRDLINQSPAPSYAGRLASREVSPLRSQSVLSNRSGLTYNFKHRHEGSSTILNSDSYNRELKSTASQRNLYNTRYSRNNSVERGDNRTNSVDRGGYYPEDTNGNAYRTVDEVGFNSDKNKRKGSTGVTFALPDDGNDHKEQTAVYGQFSISAAAYRRMSAPELPPISNNNTSKGGNGKTPRGDKRKTSTNSIHSSGSKASINQLAAAVNSKTYYNRKASTNTIDGSSVSGGNSTTFKKGKKKKLPIPRNHSDSSLKNLVALTSSQSQESGSTVNSYPTATADGGGDNSSGGGGGGLKQIKYLSNGHRALSWCATDNSGSQTKLETLFEGQSNSNINNNNNNNNSLTTNNNNNTTFNSVGGRLTYSPLGNPIKKTSSSNSISNIPYGGNISSDMPAIVPPRSISVNGIRSREDIARLEALNKKLISENGDVEVDTVEEFVSRARMKRSSSENKLTGKSQQRGGGGSTTGHGKHQSRTSQRSLSRNLSVDRIEKLTSNSKPQRKNMTSSRSNNGANYKLRRVSSVTNLPNNGKNSRATYNDNQDEVFDDEESIEASARLVEWLNVVNNIDEYDTDPKDTVVEYSDEPPQTDTAIHLVYGGGE